MITLDLLSTIHDKRYECLPTVYLSNDQFIVAKIKNRWVIVAEIRKHSPFTGEEQLPNFTDANQEYLNRALETGILQPYVPKALALMQLRELVAKSA